MKILIQRWPGPRGRRSESFGWHHYYILRNVSISWRWKR